MTLKQLKYLITIADNGLNISSAAEKLFTSQPGISKQIKYLEAELGMQLFKRKGKSLVSITNAGLEVIEKARNILRESENIKRIAGDLSGEEEGKLSIATTHTQARYILPDIIKNFTQKYPKIDLELHQGTSEQIAELINTHQVDFAMATGAIKYFPSLKLLPLFHWNRIILVPKNHPISKKKLSLESLSSYPLVTYIFSLTGDSSFKQAFIDKNLNPRVVFTARDADIIKTYVRIGMGVGVVASMTFEENDSNDLTPIDASNLFPEVTTWLGFPKDMVLRSYMKDFISMLSPIYNNNLMKQIIELNDQDSIENLLSSINFPTYRFSSNKNKLTLN